MRFLPRRLANHAETEHELISISKPKLLALIIILLSATVGWETYFVLAIPSSSDNSIIEPGSLHTIYDYIMYISSDNTTVIGKNGATGAQTCSSSVTRADIAIQCAVNTLEALPCCLGGHADLSTTQVPQASIYFSRGVYDIGASVAYTGPFPIQFFGEGRNRSLIYLLPNVNDDVFSINCAAQCNIISFDYLKIDSSPTQSGTSWCIDVGPNAVEVQLHFVELKACVTGGIRLQNTSTGWNDFDDVWFYSDGIGLQTSAPDVRIVNSHFASDTVGFRSINNATGMFTIVGNTFWLNTRAIDLRGTAGLITITGNTFAATTTAAIDLVVAPGLVTISGNTFSNSVISFEKQPVGCTVSGNVFRNWGSQTALKFFDSAGGQNECEVSGNDFANAVGIGVYIGNNDDNLSVQDNQFDGVTTPVSYGTGTRTKLMVSNNQGYNPIGLTANLLVGSTFAPWGTPGATLAVPFIVVYGDKINFGAFSVAPTVTVWFT